MVTTPTVAQKDRLKEESKTIGTGKLAGDKEYAHNNMQKRVTDCKNDGQNVILMVDFNPALNDTAKPFNMASRKLLEWEKTADKRILNNKQVPNRVPPRKGDQPNCLDLMMISPGLENKTYNYMLNLDQEWSSAKAETTGVGKGAEIMYLRGKPTDHMAQKVTVVLDLVEKGKSGNRAIINYNNKEGWKLYPKVSNEFAHKIMRAVRIYKDKNEIQKEFKNIMHKIDVNCFRIKYKKSKSSSKKMEIQT